MSEDSDKQGGVLTLRVPNVLSLKDLITIVSVAVSIAIAWGVFSTRLTVVERELVTIRQELQSTNDMMDRIQQGQSRLNAHQQDDELLIDQLYTIMKRPIPTRRAQR